VKVVVFCHSLASDWNHGNAHFLRGIVAELQARGHDVETWEPRHGWSRTNLLRDHGEVALGAFRAAFPDLRSRLYELDGVDPARIVEGADLVLVHEWSDPWLVAELGRARQRDGGFQLLFHDTHHRAVTKPEEMERYDLSAYDGVLAYGAVLRDVYLERGWAGRAWTWHEAADTRVFRPREGEPVEGDLVWIGNWGDGERTKELHEFLLEPAAGLRAFLHGVRYPEAAVRAAAQAGLVYRGWVANHEVPRLFARNRVTVHVPRRPYVESLPGIPTIRPFEALACGIPLISARWDRTGGLFTPGADFLVAHDGDEMTTHLRLLMSDPDRRAALAAHGLATVRARHTCAHRVDELLNLYEQMDTQLLESA
jgi:spore maturation protein CgeB